MFLRDYTNDGSDYIFGLCDYPGKGKPDRCLLRQAESCFELIFNVDQESYQYLLPDLQSIPISIWVRDVLSKDSYCIIDAHFSNASADTNESWGSVCLRTDCVVKCSLEGRWP